MRPVILVTFLFTVFGQLYPANAVASPDFSRICARAVAAAENANRLPRFLLRAVSLAESGRWNERAQAAIAWPWTITAEGEGRFFPTREKALAEIRRLRARGISNIDVGCMQINVHYHGEAFRKIEEMIEPVNNVAYAAVLLKDLRLRTGSWAHAVGRYHNGNWKGRGKNYWARVRTRWRAEHLRDFRARRAARIERNLKTRVAADR